MLSLLGSLMGGIVTYIILKRTISDDAILDKIDFITDEIMKNEDLEKKVYSIGALLGSGIAQGTGLQKKGGKFGIQDLVMQVAGQWLAGKGVGAAARQEEKPLISLHP